MSEVVLNAQDPCPIRLALEDLLLRVDGWVGDWREGMGCLHNGHDQIFHSHS